jgi:hypothetical protein
MGSSVLLPFSTGTMARNHLTGIEDHAVKVAQEHEDFDWQLTRTGGDATIEQILHVNQTLTGVLDDEIRQPWALCSS